MVCVGLAVLFLLRALYFAPFVIRPFPSYETPGFEALITLIPAAVFAGLAIECVALALRVVRREQKRQSNQPSGRLLPMLSQNQTHLS